MPIVMIMLRVRLSEKDVLVGDFNDLVSNSEKIGGKIHSQSSMDDF